MEEAYAAKQLAMKPELYDICHSITSPNDLSCWNDIKPLSLQNEQEERNVLVVSTLISMPAASEEHYLATCTIPCELVM